MQSTKTSLSFFAAEIFAYICSEGIKFWSISSIDFKSILNELVRTPIKKYFIFFNFKLYLYSNTVKCNFKVQNT
jgi:hypothetical protein